MTDDDAVSSPVVRMIRWGDMLHMSRRLQEQFRQASGPPASTTNRQRFDL